MRKILLMVASLLLFSMLAMAQKTMSGTVSDVNGNPIPNASVMVKGTNLGTSTDDNGRFNLTVPANRNAIIVTAVGMREQEIAVAASGVLTIVLSSLEAALDEVVVTAFGIKKDKSTVGYGISQVAAEELTRSHTTNITNALSAKVPGVRVTGSGGSFAGSNILIRGYTTFTGNNQPLFVVDGIPIDNGGGSTALQTGTAVSNRAIDLNQDDIESVSVLKGASAAVLYGSRAAAGVILITTKKGNRARQKNAIEFSSSYQMEEVNRIPTYQNLYAQGNNGVFSPTAQTSWGPKITGQQVTNAYDPATNTNTRTETLKAYPNNVKDMFQKGMNWQNNVAFSGGTDKNTFRFSYGYLKNSGILPNNLLQRHNVSLNASSKINDYLTVTASGNYSNNQSKRSQQGNQLSNPLFRGWFTPRSYDLTGLAFENAIGEQRYPLGEDNPYWTLKHNRYNDEINRFIGNVGLNIKLTEDLQFDYKLGTDVHSTFRHAYDQIGARGQANTAANAAGGVREIRNNYRALNSNAFFSFNKKVFEDFNTSVIVGTEYQQTFSRTAQMDGKGIIVRDFEQLSNTTSYTPSPANGSTKFRLLGLYGDFTAGYKNIANLNVTVRNDWASTFKIGNNSYLYAGFGGSLTVSELLPSLKSDIVDLVRIKGNIATAGKAGDYIYATDSYFAAAGSADGFGPTINFPFNGIQGFTLSNTAGDPNLGPEFTRNKEITLELGLFKRRLNIEATRYWQKSTNLIFAVPVSAASGITSMVTNAGDMSNKGVELAINAIPVIIGDFKWQMDISYTQFKSIVDKLAPGVPNIFLGGFVTPNIRLVEGDEYGQIYGNAFQRDTKTGKIIVAANGLPLITSGVQKIGNPNAKWIGGLTNTFSWKGISLSVLMEYKKGGQMYSRNIADLLRNGVVAETAEFERYDASGTVQTPYLFDAVYADGTPNTTKVSAQNYFGNSGIHAAAEGFIYETTWFRVREASLSFRAPKSIVDKTPFGNIELSAFGRNLFLKAPHYPHLDPEQNALGINNAQGLEFNALPQTRSMGIGLKLNF